jgi:hypothetical protein|tara:strand:- start:182 stop:475 length:294 start_codon:yes stop_codon:yes gene_type:complete
MNKKRAILDNIFSGSDDNHMEFKRSLFNNNPPQELMQHTKSHDIPWGSKMAQWMLDYYLKTGNMKSPDFYSKAGYTDYYYPDEIQDEKEEELDTESY